MKRILAALVAVCGLGALSFALAGPTTPPAAPPSGAGTSPATRPAEGRLVVHEWGTFTGLAGSDGAHLPFGVTVGQDLPPFVVNRLTQAQRLGQDVPIGMLFIKANGAVALQRMETPVVYFYAERPRDVSVRVDFPQGLLTEFYPPVRGMGPAFGQGLGEPGLTVATTNPAANAPAAAARPAAPTTPPPSFLDWGTVHVVPPPAGDRDAKLPATSGATQYAYARETDSAVVQFADRPGERHDEKFLFYRGLGDFSLPVTLTAAGGDRFELSNTGPQPIRFAVLLRIADDRARFAVCRDVSGRRAMALPADAVNIEQVGDAIAGALVAEGLYEKEARAMVKTWSANWLGEPGTRVLYTVPRPVTDGLLPLRIAPTPDETVRVLVGRIDVLTPEQEQHLLSMMASATTTPALAPADAAELRGFGRFLLPALDRAARLRGGDAKKAHAEADALYWLLRAAPTPATEGKP